MQSMFVFFDMEQPLIQFFAEYLAMMGLGGVSCLLCSKANSEEVCIKGMKVE